MVHYYLELTYIYFQVTKGQFLNQIRIAKKALHTALVIFLGTKRPE